MMGKVRTGWVCVLCLGLGLAWGQCWSSSVVAVFAEDLPAVTPAVAGSQSAKPNTVTTTEHLRLAAEHLDAAGQSGLAQHVRQLAEQPTSNKETNAPTYAPMAPPRALPLDAVPPTDWLPRPVVPPRGRVSIEVPPELDDGHLRWVQPVGRKFESKEIRTTAAPPSGPI